MKNGKLIIVSGPSGVGKKTILDHIYTNKSLDIVQSVSMTTRNPRVGEVNGKDYFFVSREEFLKNIENNNFLEYATYNNNYYGTNKLFVQEQLNNGKNVLLEIDTLGVKKILSNNITALKIFIAPKNIDVLKERLEKRGTEAIQVINERIEKAKEEMQLTNLYDYVVINDDLEEAVKEVEKIIKTMHS